MSLQFISDSTGKTTGVFIPINEWNDLKNRFKGIEQEETAVPDWHIQEVRKRVGDHKNASTHLLDFDETLDDIEKGL